MKNLVFIFFTTFNGDLLNEISSEFFIPTDKSMLVVRAFPSDIICLLIPSKMIESVNVPPASKLKIKAIIQPKDQNSFQENWQCSFEKYDHHLFVFPSLFCFLGIVFFQYFLF